MANASVSPPPPAGEAVFPRGFVFTGALQRYLHVDLGLCLSLLLLLGSAAFVWPYMSDYLYDCMQKYFMATVKICDDDEAYTMVMMWVAEQPFARNSRHTIANISVGSRCLYVQDKIKNAYTGDSDCEEDDDDADDEKRDMAGDDAEKRNMPDAEKRRRKMLSYTPVFGTSYFWYRGRLLLFRRQNGGGTIHGSDRALERVTLSCFGRSPAVLKTLLDDARRLYLRYDQRQGIVYRGSASGRPYGGGSAFGWTRRTTRRPRPLASVILDATTQQALLADMADHLTPANRRWYADHSIPYRRGYLFYGPPGTGKSSLGLALAGHFRLSIYLITFHGPADEDALCRLLEALPPRCILLLKNIDSAGLTSTPEGARQEQDSDMNDSDTRKDSDMDDSDTRKDSDMDDSDTTGRLSLAGLLNLLDGLATPEGRILIMTASHVEKLDRALIRPGLVDMQVAFDRADRSVAIALFRSLFTNGTLSPPAMEALAVQFADAIPPGVFTPAELQDYLLPHKNDPAEAVAGAAVWVAASKAASTKQPKA